jgi:hypothetical protein
MLDTAAEPVSDIAERLAGGDSLQHRALQGMQRSAGPAGSERGGINF